MRPPLLTRRQFQVLELINSGISRDEIAKRLKISPETVKSHTKAVQEKFNVSSLRAASRDLHEYVTNYTPTGSDGKFFLTDITRIYDVNSNFYSAHMHHRSEGYVVNGTLTKFRVGLRSPLAPQNVTINDQSASRMTKVGETRNYYLDLDRPLTPGDWFVRDAHYDIIDPPNIRFSFTAELITAPVETLTMIMNFEGDPPPNLGVNILKDGERVDIKDIHPEAEITIGDSVKLTLNHPLLHSRYSVHWD